MSAFPAVDPGLVTIFWYAMAALAALVLIAASPLPAALFWAVGAGLHAALAIVELAHALGFSGLAGLAPDLRFQTATLGSLGFGFGAIFSVALPPRARYRPVLSAVAIAVLMASWAGRLPVDLLPIPLLVLGMLMLAILVGLRHRPAPARWLFVGTLLLALAELGRHRFLPGFGLPPEDLGRAILAAALPCFGLAARASR